MERDLAYALKAKECPQILFLRGNRIVYRAKDFRTADELVHMIAHFYYKAKRPSWVDKAKVYGWGRGEHGMIGLGDNGRGDSSQPCRPI